jgi:membrane-associated phospholipid phosphatase
VPGVAWSRTYLQVHWVSDVVGGSLLGIGIALLSFAGAQLWQAGPSSTQRGERPASSAH